MAGLTKFAILRSGNRVLDYVQEKLGTTVNRVVDLLSNGLTFVDSFDAEYLTVSITTPATDWVAPSLAATVTNFGSGYETAAYRKDAQGVVHVRGLVVRSTTGTIFTLPTGYQPAQNFTIGCDVSAGAPDVMGRLDVKGAADVNAGQVQILGTAPSTYGSIKMSFPCLDLSPGVLSCFPVMVSPKKVTAPVAIQLVSATDTSTAPVIPALGQLTWGITSTGAVRLTNLPGLLLGRTYLVKLLLIGG